MRGGLLFANGSGLLSRLFARGFAYVLDEIDERLVAGGIDLTLPDGGHRRLGFRADGPVAVVHLKSWYALVRLATSGSIGWYRASAKGEWTSPDPVPLFTLFMLNRESLGETGRSKGIARLFNLAKHRLRGNDLAGARDNIEAHYDLGNDFYAAWLDRTMTYSSARFESADSDLEQAQLHKVATLLDRLDLQPGQRLLEIGCGWGTLAIEAAKRGVKVVGLTLSTEQKDWAQRKIAEQQLSDRIEIRLQDYRETNDQFDAVASVEMVEAVGQQYWGAYLESISRNLKPGGRAVLQLISIDHALFDSYSKNPDFIQAYIFPGGLLIDEPSFAALAIEQGLSWQDREGFALDYAETLKRWRLRFDEAVERGELAAFSPAFHNLWRYYLMYCEGGFRGGGIDVAQVTMVKG